MQQMCELVEMSWIEKFGDFGESGDSDLLQPYLN